MKYTILALSALLFMGGCCSSSSKKQADQNQNVQPQAVIVDEEYDLLIAPEYDYEKEVPYAEQIKNTPQPAAKTAKPTKKPAAIKQ